ncbi:respiratory nitrate reductase 1 beta chain [Desulfosporosinus acididurans]|uniref:Respiratory nitrate reductase 1 beta chain n=1 Tax=Desulfosporosinus acididurans TaxID=476652 RepID=A0A0J1IJJ3_9FIRM|nr:nitrate reductase subunit beta [Desulfosporosinus acididurans]KLU64896.1 respiratory nitrate reductase 1 beta chain [Desulfosporosinus acididurans]
MKIKAQIAMVINLDKCIGCHTCSVTCKNTWTNRPGTEYTWFNNVETKPGIGYPREWENQDKYRGGWVRKNNGSLELKAGNKLTKLLNIFHNPDLPVLDDYYEPWTYNYENLTNSPSRKHQPIARPQSLITGETMELTWGPNWEDDLAGAQITGKKDVNLKTLQEKIRFTFEETFMLHLPRLCEHCLNPACVASCPSGAIYKRDEDGIVLVDQEACRGWRFCMSGCPYKKVYFNWKTQKAEKCTLCFPRLEAGLPTVCSETCSGRVRYVGVLLYDADRIQETASSDESDLYKNHLSLFLDPRDPKVITQAQKDGISDDWLAAAQKSPIYQLAIEHGVALPLHPEYRTLPMVWYIPPLSPIMRAFEGNSAQDIFPAIDQMRIPLDYLANLLTAGNREAISLVLKKMTALRQYMRNLHVNKERELQIPAELGITESGMQSLYHLLAIAKYSDRFVIPTAHREQFADLYAEQGTTGYSFAQDCSTCSAGKDSALSSDFFSFRGTSNE